MLLCLPLYVDGLIWVINWHSLQHSMASAFLAVLYSDYMLTSQTEILYCDGETYKPEDLREFAKSQVQQLIGNETQNAENLCIIS